MYLSPVHKKNIYSPIPGYVRPGVSDSLLKFNTTILNTYIFIIGLKPRIADQVENITVALGRDAKLQCQVKDLQDYKVNFLHL